MLVLSRSSPKSIPQTSPALSLPPPPPPLPQPPNIPGQTRFESDSISLRPLGRTSSGLSLSLSPLNSPRSDKELSPSPKSNWFVLPHFGPGFVGREEWLELEFQKQPGARSREYGVDRQGHFGSPNRYREDERPKSRGGYERMLLVGDSDPMRMNRPVLSGSRPSSSG